MAAIKEWIRKNGVGYAFMLPFLVLFIAFTVAPVLIAIFLSLTNYNLLQAPGWVGLNNFKLLFLDDDVFLIALNNTMIFALITGPLGYIMSFIAAWTINQLSAKRWFSLAFYAPSICSSVAMSVVWLYFFSPDRYGLINNMLINLGITTEPILWTTDPAYIMGVVMLISVWMSMGTGFLVFLSGLQNMNKEYYEAGEIDGIKNRFQELWYLTLPMMKPQLLFGAIDAIVKSFSVFDVASTVAGFPSPQYAAHTIVAHLYDYAFIRFQTGYSSAISVCLFLFTFLLGRVVMGVLKSRD